MIKGIIITTKIFNLTKYKINPILFGLSTKQSHTHSKTIFIINTIKSTNLTNDSYKKIQKKISEPTNSNNTNNEQYNKIKLIMQDKLKKN